MVSEPTIFSLIAQLYEAAGDKLRWPCFLENLANAFGGSGTQLVLFNTQSGGGEIIVNVRLDPDYLKSYNAYYVTRDYWVLRGSQYFQKPTVITSQQICSDDELEHSEFCADFLRRIDSFHMIAAIAAKDGDQISVVTSLRPQRAGRFEQTAISAIQILLPHFERALQLQRRLEVLQTQAGAFAGVLDCLPLGLLIVGSSGKIIQANRAAEEILAQSDGLASAHGGLHAAQPDETVALRGLVFSACATASGRGYASGGAMSIWRPSLKRPFSVLVIPLSRGVSSSLSASPAAAVFVTDPEAEAEPQHAALSRFFGLTAAESRLAMLLMQGKSIEQAAEELFLSLNTARTHIKRIYSKTGTSRQSDLIRLLLRSPAQLRLR